MCEPGEPRNELHPWRKSVGERWRAERMENVRDHALPSKAWVANQIK